MALNLYIIRGCQVVLPKLNAMGDISGQQPRFVELKYFLMKKRAQSRSDSIFELFILFSTKPSKNMV